MRLPQATSGNDVCKRLVADLGPTTVRNFGIFSKSLELFACRAHHGWQERLHEASVMLLELVYACKVQIHAIANASR